MRRVGSEATLRHYSLSIRADVESVWDCDCVCKELSVVSCQLSQLLPFRSFFSFHYRYSYMLHATEGAGLSEDQREELRCLRLRLC